MAVCLGRRSIESPGRWPEGTYETVRQLPLRELTRTEAFRWLLIGLAHDKYRAIRKTLDPKNADDKPKLSRWADATLHAIATVADPEALWHDLQPAEAPVVLAAIDDRTASPRAPPTCWEVLIRPEARPASAASMFVVASRVTGTNVKPIPIDIVIRPGKRSAR